MLNHNNRSLESIFTFKFNCLFYKKYKYINQLDNYVHQENERMFAIFIPSVYMCEVTLLEEVMTSEQRVEALS